MVPLQFTFNGGLAYFIVITHLSFSAPDGSWLGSRGERCPKIMPADSSVALKYPVAYQRGILLPSLFRFSVFARGIVASNLFLGDVRIISYFFRFHRWLIVPALIFVPFYNLFVG